MKQSTHLILSVDYEVFGDGTGDVDCCVIEPAKNMMDIAERFNAPITFFVESLEFIAMEQTTATRDSVERIQKQLIKAIGKGHDVQLHLHPQWYSAKYNSEGIWQLDMKHWRIGDLEEHKTANVLRNGKYWLEALLQPIEENYRCNVFRAGGWCIQPSEKIVKGMLELGIDIDSTVAPGLYNSTKGEWCDFRNAPDSPIWRVDSDICTPTETGILEIPITTGKISRWRHLQAVKLSRAHDNGGMANGCCGSYQGVASKSQAGMGKLKKLLRLGHVMLDFSTMPTDVLIDITKQWLNKQSNTNMPIPIVAIAHTKNFTKASSLALNSYLKWAEANHIQFSTYGKYLESMGA